MEVNTASRERERERETTTTTTHKVGVDFVGDDWQPKRLGGAQNLAQMSPRVDRAARVRRIVDDYTRSVVVGFTDQVLHVYLPSALRLHASHLHPD